MCRRVSFSSALVSLSIFSPFLPMITPTRLDVTTTVTRSRVRSMRMSEMAGRCSLRSFLSVRYFWMNFADLDVLDQQFGEVLLAGVPRAPPAAMMPCGTRSVGLSDPCSRSPSGRGHSHTQCPSYRSRARNSPVPTNAQSKDREPVAAPALVSGPLRRQFAGWCRWPGSRACSGGGRRSVPAVAPVAVVVAAVGGRLGIVASSGGSDSVTMMCDIRRLIWNAVPRARGWIRLNIGAPSTRHSLDDQCVRVRRFLVGRRCRRRFATTASSTSPRGWGRTGAVAALRPRSCRGSGRRTAGSSGGRCPRIGVWLVFHGRVSC